MPSWNADQYLQFADERTRPCHDLINRIALMQPHRIIDLGCGPGNSTEALTERWPEAEVTGLDGSPDMIAAARRSHPNRRWLHGDIATWSADVPYDLVFSNAAVHWVPDHSVAFPRLLQQVAPGGAFAVQVPANFDAHAHRLMQELAYSQLWRNHFPRKVREWLAHEPAFYYDAVAPLAQRIDLWTTEYFHIMQSPKAIVEWYKGTGLRPFLDLLTAVHQDRFLAEYEALLASAYPRRSDGHVLFPFLRLFLIAYR
jgi:trans-aconitate 2-methyltransferase